MKVTLKDIAEDTGLSISTVSRALKGTGQISSANEKRIFESAQRLHYPLRNRPTPVNLKSSIHVAIITKFNSGEFYSSFFSGFNNSAATTNINFGLYNIYNRDVDIVDYLNELRRQQFDAAVIFLSSLNEDDYKRILDQVPLEFPLISAAPIATPVMDTITFDNYRGGHLVAKHFIERGYRKFGLISGMTKKSEVLLRKSGFLDYISNFDDAELIWDFEGDYTNEAGYWAFNEFEKLPEKPRAVFSFNDSMAFSFMQMAQRKGLKIPEDVAISGYDDLPNCQLYHPTLTSVRTDYTNLGKLVLDHLQKRLTETKNHNGYTNLIPVSLSVRESS